MFFYPASTHKFQSISRGEKSPYNMKSLIGLIPKFVFGKTRVGQNIGKIVFAKILASTL